MKKLLVTFIFILILFAAGSAVAEGEAAYKAVISDIDTASRTVTLSAHDGNVIGVFGIGCGDAVIYFGQSCEVTVGSDESGHSVVLSAVPEEGRNITEVRSPEYGPNNMAKDAKVYVNLDRGRLSPGSKAADYAAVFGGRDGRIKLVDNNGDGLNEYALVFIYSSESVLESMTDENGTWKFNVIFGAEVADYAPSDYVFFDYDGAPAKLEEISGNSYLATLTTTVCEGGLVLHNISTSFAEMSNIVFDVAANTVSSYFESRVSRLNGLSVKSLMDSGVDAGAVVAINCDGMIAYAEAYRPDRYGMIIGFREDIDWDYGDRNTFEILDAYGYVNQCRTADVVRIYDDENDGTRLNADEATEYIRRLLAEGGGKRIIKYDSRTKSNIFDREIVGIVADGYNNFHMERVENAKASFTDGVLSLDGREINGDAFVFARRLGVKDGVPNDVLAGPVSQFFTEQQSYSAYISGDNDCILLENVLLDYKGEALHSSKPVYLISVEERDDIYGHSAVIKVIDVYGDIRECYLADTVDIYGGDPEPKKMTASEAAGYISELINMGTEYRVVKISQKDKWYRVYSVVTCESEGFRLSAASQPERYASVFAVEKGGDPSDPDDIVAGWTEMFFPENNGKNIWYYGDNDGYSDVVLLTEATTEEYMPSMYESIDGYDDGYIFIVDTAEMSDLGKPEYGVIFVGKSEYRSGYHAIGILTDDMQLDTDEGRQTLSREAAYEKVNGMLKSPETRVLKLEKYYRKMYGDIVSGYWYLNRLSTEDMPVRPIEDAVFNARAQTIGIGALSPKAVIMAVCQSKDDPNYGNYENIKATDVEVLTFDDLYDGAAYTGFVYGKGECVLLLNPTEEIVWDEEEFVVSRAAITFVDGKTAIYLEGSRGGQDVETVILYDEDDSSAAGQYYDENTGACTIAPGTVIRTGENRRGMVKVIEIIR